MLEVSQVTFQPHTRFISLLRAIPKFAGMGVAILAALILILWSGEQSAVKNILGESFRMLPGTACGMLVLAMALWFLSEPQRQTRLQSVARILVQMVLVASLIWLLEYIVGHQQSFEQKMFWRLIGNEQGNPESISLNKAVTFLITSLALLLLDKETRTGLFPSQILALTGLANAFMAVLGFVYGASSLYGLVKFPGLSFPAALSFVALNCGILCSRPERGLMTVMISDSAGGFTARRLLLAAILAPTLLGWLQLFGDKAGFYDSASGVALFAVSTIVTFFAIIWRNAAMLQDLDLQRQHAERELRQANNELERRVSERTAELATMNAGLKREIAERRKVEDQKEQLLSKEQAARTQAEEYGLMIRRLQSVTDGALAHLKLDDLLREMLLRVRDVLQADSVVIMLLDEERKQLSVRATIDQEVETTNAVNVPLGTGVTGQIVASRSPLIINRLVEKDFVNSEMHDHLQSLIGVPLFTEGRLIGVIHAGTITERLFTEDDLHLLQLVADRVALAIEQSRLYEAEKRARVQAETANRMKDEFLAIVSHELRSPLNAVLGWASLLREGQLSGEQTTHALQIIDNAARSQNRIISDLLDVSRIVSGKLRLNLSPIDATTIINTAIEAVRFSAEAKSIRIIEKLDSKAGRILGDADRVQQIIGNLLSNAIKFTPKGGSVTVELRQVGVPIPGPEIQPSATTGQTQPLSKRHLEIIVSDSGQGIKPEFLPFVFDRFRQADASSARKHGGLGLGLAIVRNLTEMHGGQVSVSSGGEGQGAQFVLQFPLAEDALQRGLLKGPPEEREMNDSARQPTANLLQGLRVLVVDDDLNARELSATVLTGCAAEVRTASSASEALAMIESWQPTILISDIEMPEADGYELIRTIRAMKDLPVSSIPAIAVTAYARAEDRMRALTAGFQMHLAKPIDPMALAMIISKLVTRTEQAGSVG